MTLSQMAVGSSAQVAQIDGGLGIRRNLNQLGIHVGDGILLAGRGAFHGPLLVQIHGMQVALGRGVAHHIHVEQVTAPTHWRTHHGQRSRHRHRHQTS